MNYPRTTNQPSSYDYEPEYDLVAAHARNQHAYKTDPRSRKFSDELWAKGQATARSWFEAYEREAQMCLPLKEFRPWMWFDRPTPYAEPEKLRVQSQPVKGENL